MFVTLGKITALLATAEIPDDTERRCFVATDKSDSTNRAASSPSGGIAPVNPSGRPPFGLVISPPGSSVALPRPGHRPSAESQSPSEDVTTHDSPLAAVRTEHHSSQHITQYYEVLRGR